MPVESTYAPKEFPAIIQTHDVRIAADKVVGLFDPIGWPFTQMRFNSAIGRSNQGLWPIHVQNRADVEHGKQRNNCLGVHPETAPQAAGQPALGRDPGNCLFFLDFRNEAITRLKGKSVGRTTNGRGMCGFQNRKAGGHEPPAF